MSIVAIVAPDITTAVEIERTLSKLGHTYPHYMLMYLQDSSYRSQPASREHRHRPLARLKEDISHLKKLKKPPVLLNTICIDLIEQQLMSYIDSTTDGILLVNYCLHPTSCLNKVFTVPPYTTVTEILVNRSLALFTDIDEISIHMMISSESLNFLSTSHNTDTATVLNMLEELVKRTKAASITEHYGIEVASSNKDVTEFSLTVKGTPKGYKKGKTFMYKIEVFEDQATKSYISQILAFLTVIDREHTPRTCVCPPDIGLDEGLYSLFFTYLINYGVKFSVDIL